MKGDLYIIEGITCFLFSLTFLALYRSKDIEEDGKREPSALLFSIAFLFWILKNGIFHFEPEFVMEDENSLSTEGFIVLSIISVPNNYFIFRGLSYSDYFPDYLTNIYDNKNGNNFILGAFSVVLLGEIILASLEIGKWGLLFEAIISSYLMWLLLLVSKRSFENRLPDPFSLIVIVIGLILLIMIITQFIYALSTEVGIDQTTVTKISAVSKVGVGISILLIYFSDERKDRNFLVRKDEVFLNLKCDKNVKSGQGFLAQINLPNEKENHSEEWKSITERRFITLLALALQALDRRNDKKEFPDWVNGIKIYTENSGSLSVNPIGSRINLKRLREDLKITQINTFIKSSSGNGFKLDIRPDNIRIDQTVFDENNYSEKVRDGLKLVLTFPLEQVNNL